MNWTPVILGYFVPIIVVVLLFVIFKVRRSPLPFFEKPKTEARIALFVFILFAAIVVLSTAIFKPAHDISNLPTESKLHSLLVWLLLLLPFIAVLVLRRQTLDTCLLPTKGFFLHLVVSFAMGLAAIFVYALTIGKVEVVPSVLANLFTISSLFLLIPIFMEEFVFRGFLLARFTAGFGKHKGILLSALLFGLIHYPRYLMSSQLSFLQVTQTIVLIVAVSVGGGYGIYAIRYMLYGVFIHWCMNIVQVSIPTG
jgi:membrane protease YdiL (CAAX protease family)